MGRAEVIVVVMTVVAAGPEPTVGMLVKRWRERRRRSQLDVSVAAEVSSRHLSFIETGRAQPSREMIERLCAELDVPLRERNRLHLAAGYAPVHPERAFEDLGAARDAVQAVLRGMEPNPAAAVNVRWDLIAANDAMRAFLVDLPVEPGSRVNMLRVTLHPDGLAPRIRNLRQWRAHVIGRVRRQRERTAAEGLDELLAELEGYDVPAANESPGERQGQELVVPLQLGLPDGELSLLYTATVFGSPRDVTLDEIAIETFFPADADTARALRTAADARDA